MRFNLLRPYELEEWEIVKGDWRSYEARGIYEMTYYSYMA